MTNQPRYGNQDLCCPRASTQNSRTALSTRSKVRSAFPRQVDLWWYAIGIGITEGHRTPLPDRDELVKFNDGGILESDP